MSRCFVTLALLEVLALADTLGLGDRKISNTERSFRLTLCCLKYLVKFNVQPDLQLIRFPLRLVVFFNKVTQFSNIYRGSSATTVVTLTMYARI